MNRILWNPEKQKWQGQETIDEIVLEKVEMVHFEQMSDECYWLGISLPDVAQRVDVNFWAEGGKIFCVMQESNIEWEENKQHES